MDVLKRRLFLIVLVLCMAMSGCSINNPTSILDKKQPIIVTVLTHYNGVQLEKFEKIIKEFNNTVGDENGVIIDLIKATSNVEMNKMLISSANSRAGSIDFPDMFISNMSMYSYIKDKKGVIDFSDYFTKEELKDYDLDLINLNMVDDKIVMFPLGQSTTLLYVNKTDFDRASYRMGTSYKDISTYEGLVEVARKYYEYTDSLTPQPNDGKSLYGDESISIQVIKILASMNKPLITQVKGRYNIELSKKEAKKIWDLYYVPIIKGYYAKYGNYISEDLKTGKILIGTAYTSSSMYFSDVVFENNDSRKIELYTTFSPQLSEYKTKSIQQGRGIFVSTNSEEKENACVLFIKWLTNKENNLKFALKMSYIPTRIDNISKEYIDEVAKTEKIDTTVVNAIRKSMEQVNSRRQYLNLDIDLYEPVSETLKEIFDKEIYIKRKELLNELNNGNKSYEELIQEYTSEEEFNKWYDDILGRITLATK